MKRLAWYTYLFVCMMIGAALGPLPVHAATTPPSFTILDATGDEAEGQICFTVNKHGKLNSQPSTVEFSQIAGTALAQTDFVKATANLVFQANELTKQACVALVNDQIAEPTEKFTGKLRAVSNARLYDGTAVGTITDSDPTTPIPPPTLPRTFTPDDVSVNESAGTVTITVHATNNNSEASFLQWGTVAAHGTAQAGTDYVASSGGVTLPATWNDFTITVPILNDQNAEGDETFNVELGVFPMDATHPANGTVTRQAVVTIIDDDAIAPPPSPVGGWTPAPLYPLSGVEYVQATTACPSWYGPTPKAGDVFKVIAGTWGWTQYRQDADVNTPGGHPGGMIDALPLDQSGNPISGASYVSLFLDCLAGVTPAK